MEIPEVRFTRADDGVDIAYGVVGEGPSWVFVPPTPYPSFQVTLQAPTFGPLLDVLGQGRRLVIYDNRGVGLSGEPTRPITVEGLVSDLVAVVAASDCGPAGLVTLTGGAFSAAEFAAGHPDRTRALVVVAPSVEGDAWLEPHRSLLPVLEADYPLWAQTLIRRIFNWNDVGDLPERFLHTIPQRVARELYAAVGVHDLSGALPRVRVPATVIHSNSGNNPWSLQSARNFASRIPGGTLEITESYFFDEDGAAFGRVLSEAMAHLDARPATDATAGRDNPDGLTPRELEVVRLLAPGKSNREIAEVLVISPDTVGRHVSNILNKTDLPNRAALSRYATVHGLVD